MAPELAGWRVGPGWLKCVLARCGGLRIWILLHSHMLPHSRQRGREAQPSLNPYRKFQGNPDGLRVTRPTAQLGSGGRSYGAQGLAQDWRASCSIPVNVRYRFASLCPAVVQFRKGPRSAETHNRN